MKQYTELGRRLINEGVWVTNPRTGVRCKTLINADMEYDVENGIFPLVDTRKVPEAGLSAIMELIGYICGFDSAEKFRNLGCSSWDGNANTTEAWLANPNRKGHDDMGRVYGVQGNDWTNQFGEKFNQFKKVISNLTCDIDDRGEIITFWNPGEFKYGCLRPCMHTHQFSILNDKLYLHSFQRSCDLPLGGTWNPIQVYTLLALVSRITGIPASKAYHKMVNIHVYENQYELFVEQMSRTPSEVQPRLSISSRIETYDDLITATKDDFKVTNYVPQPAIKYPFTA